MTIKAKLITLSITLTLIPSLAVSYLVSHAAIEKASTSLQAAAEQKLIAVRNTTGENIQRYFETIEDQVTTYSNDLMILEALEAMTPAFYEHVNSLQSTSLSEQRNSLNDYYVNDYEKNFQSLNGNQSSNPDSLLANIDDAAVIMQKLYISDNPAGLGEKDKMEMASSGSRYDELHQRYHEPFRDIQTSFGFYDIFLVDAESGHVIYSVFKELDYATSLKTGPYADSGLGAAYQKAVVSTDHKQAFMTDFAPYVPSYNAPASFISSPVFKGEQLLGVLIFQMPVDRINDVMTHNKHWKSSGLGDTGQTYLVGGDFNMRSDSRFLVENKADYLASIEIMGLPRNIMTAIDTKETSIGLQPVNTIAVKKAVAGEEGFEIFDDYRKISVLSAFKPLSILGFNWAVISEIDAAEAFAPIDALQESINHRAIIVSIIAILAGAIIGWIISEVICRPISRMNGVLQELAKGEGDLTQRIPVNGKDELATLATEVNTFIDYLDNTFSSLLSSIVRMIPIAEDQNEVISTLKASINVQQAQTVSVSDSLQETGQSSELVVVELDEINNATKVGTSTVSDSHSVVVDASTAMNDLVKNIDDSVNALQLLQADTDKIASVVDVINSISEQTNLLALNAAIEAARAGEAGRGFAVVADEVRTLASKTRQSTDEVSDMVNAIQSGTGTVVSSMQLGKKNAESTSKSMSAATDKLQSVSDAMSLIDGRVGSISEAITAQRESFSEATTQYEKLNESLAQSQASTDDASQVCNDIDKLGAKLTDLVNGFKVTKNEASTARRKIKRH